MPDSSLQRRLPGHVSIVMPTYNSAATIDRAIDSVLAQTHMNWRLIAVDDASRDDTVERLMARAATDQRITVLRAGVNKGPAAARNLALKTCDGDWVALLDADDAWRPDRLTHLLEVAETRAVDMVCDNLMGFDDHLGRETNPLFASLPVDLGVSDAVAPYFAGTYNLGYLKPMVRRSFLGNHDVAYDEILRTGEDLLFLLELLARGARAATVGDPGYIYTTPTGHESGRPSQNTRTRPRDNELALALARFAKAFRLRLDEGERRAIARRIAFLAEIGPVSEFRHARLHGDWLRALYLVLQSPAVRWRLWDVMTGRARRDHVFDPLKRADR